MCSFIRYIFEAYYIFFLNFNVTLMRDRLANTEKKLLK